jgi:SH3-like domain-containing protein
VRKLKATFITLCALAALAWLAPADAASGKAASASGLPIPRFISISSKTANLRTGPGKRYPVTWVYQRRGVPVLVTAEFDHWRKVLDADGAEGWLHKSLLSGKRTAVVSGGTRDFHLTGDTDSPIVYRAEAGVIGALDACIGGWCRMEIHDQTGWIKRRHIYGALPDEDFE